MTKDKRAFSFKKQGQAMAEFALVLPLLLVVVIGLIEVGRAIFIYSSTTNASRDAVRYAIAFGVNSNGDLHYQDCDGIRNAARRTGLLLNLEDDDIVIEYDTGLRTLTSDPDGELGTGDETYEIEYPSAPFETCDDSDGTVDGVDTGVELSCGDRVVVTVSYDFALIIPIIPLGPWPIESSAARTYYGPIDVGENAIPCE